MNIDSYPQLAPKPPAKRPPPKFDMDLRELFPEDLEPNVRPSQSFPQSFPGMQQQRMQQPQQQQSHQRQSPFQSMQPPPHSSPPQQAQQLSGASNLNSQLNSGLGLGSGQQSGADASGMAFNQQQQQPFYMQNTYNPDFMSSLPGMDFLNHAVGSATGGPSDDFNFDANGLDLGFGMGLDLQHDWSDGQQYDLFDGFFFGNNTVVNGNGNAFGGGGGGGGGGDGDAKEEGGNASGGWTGD